MKKIAAIAAAFVLAGFGFVGVSNAAAPTQQLQDVDCDDFEYQEDAQAVLEEDPDDPNRLDADNDGVACEELPSRGDSGGDDDGGGDGDTSGDDGMEVPTEIDTGGGATA
jgi:Excalibur calcium-binding domain